MDVELSDAQRMIRDATREFCRREIEPIADRIDSEDWFPRELWPKLGALGVLGVMAPVEYGGAGADLLSGVLVIEEIAKVSARSRCPTARTPTSASTTSRSTPATRSDAATCPPCATAAPSARWP